MEFHAIRRPRRPQAEITAERAVIAKRNAAAQEDARQIQIEREAVAERAQEENRRKEIDIAVQQRIVARRAQMHDMETNTVYVIVNELDFEWLPEMPTPGNYIDNLFECVLLL